MRGTASGAEMNILAAYGAAVGQCRGAPGRLRQ